MTKMAKMPSLAIGVIGAGRIGSVHAQHLHSRIPNARLVAIADSHKPSASKLADQLSVESVYENYKDLLASDKVQAVLNCSSTETLA